MRRSWMWSVHFEFFCGWFHSYRCDMNIIMNILSVSSSWSWCFYLLPFICFISCHCVSVCMLSSLPFISILFDSAASDYCQMHIVSIHSAYLLNSNEYERCMVYFSPTSNESDSVWVAITVHANAFVSLLQHEAYSKQLQLQRPHLLYVVILFIT